MKVLRINVRTKTVVAEEVPQNWQRLGGRGLIARILLDEVPPKCDPLGRYNKLIFANGFLSGYVLSSCDRISIGGKSPLTGGIKESNSGGTTGSQMARLGLKALILEDLPEEKGFGVIHISKQGVVFDDANSLVNLGTYETTLQLRSKYGKKAAMALIGPAGERQLFSACINNLDTDGRPSRVSGRGGLGAVMGSKGIKAIVFDGYGEKMDPPFDQVLFAETRKQFTQSLLNNAQVAVWRDYGTAANVAITNMLGCFPVNGFSAGRMENSNEISGEKMRELLLERPAPANPTHACMPGCVIRCSNVFGDDKGNEIVAPLEYETIGLMGGNLGIDSLDTIGKMNWYANDLGVDTIELGATIGVVAEAGLIKYGNVDQIFDCIQQIYQNTPLGRILGSGASLAGKILGVKRVPVVKGQAFAAYDPRGLKGTGITYATSPQGADHTAGFTMRAKVNHQDPIANVPLSRQTQINTAAVDSLGACLMVSAAFASSTSMLKNLLHSIHGWDVTENIQQEMGKEVILMEREFNRGAGFTEVDDRLPEWLSDEPLPPTNVVFDVTNSAIETIFNDI